MKILFIKKGNPNLGANRLAIDNFSELLVKKGIEIKISSEFETGFDVYMLSKFIKKEEVLDIKNKTNALIGAIHPSDINDDLKSIIDKSNFLLVGSLCERDYLLKYNKPVFIFPQLEKIYSRNISNKKNDENSKILKIGYHGNLEHLHEFSDELNFALEKISTEVNLELHVVYDKSLGEWKKPNVTVKEYDWTFENVLNYMSDVDIGIVPSLRKNNFIKKNNVFRNLFLNFFTKTPSKINNDYLIQFKFTSNAGRAFVFHQLKVPVISDFSPENFIINGDMNCGYLAHSYHGWYNALKELAFDKEKRVMIAENALKRFNEIYSSEKYITKFIEGVSNLKNN